MLWIQTDVSTSTLNRGPYSKRAAMSPDGRSFFINIQHPGEPASERSDPAAPHAISNWPDGRPRAATLAIRREDGGPIGT